MTKNQLHLQSKIQGLQTLIDKANLEINNIAFDAIEDFHWLDYRVSTVWECEDSPIGMCVWALDEGRFHLNCQCRYCDGPVERK